MSLTVRISDGCLVPVGNPPTSHDFPRKWVEKRVGDGTVSLSRGRLVLHGPDSDLTYRIERTPGVYCVTCGERLADKASHLSHETKKFRKHVERCDGDGEPDPQNPSGYFATAAYRAELEV